MRKLFATDPARLGRPVGPPQPDAVAQELADGTPVALRKDLVRLLGKDRVLHQLIDLVRYASDASPYRLIPQVVLLPHNVDEIAQILSYCRKSGRHATFRAAGTSLNGQSQSDDILIDVRQHWNGAQVIENGAGLKARCGTVLSHANAMLRPYARKLGPDPASGEACTLGGILANNAGGMRCTLGTDAYHTVRSLTFVTTSGAVIDTSTPDAEEEFLRTEPELAYGLLELRSQLLADEELCARVRRKFSIRNANGYHLAAFLDATTPLGIFRRLLVGSEGTLAFIAEAVIDTVPFPAVTSVVLLSLPSIEAALGLVPDLVSLGVLAVEFMAAPALEPSDLGVQKLSRHWRAFDLPAATLIVELGAASAEELERLQAQVSTLVADEKLLAPLDFARIPDATKLDWRLNEGFLTFAGKLRPQGSVLVAGDVCFPPARLVEGARDLQLLLAAHGFVAGLFGHVIHGNLQFTLTVGLNEKDGLLRYSAFMAGLAELADRCDGSLKAEHGAGLSTAPFVTREWGQKAADIMWRLKRLADPLGVLAPNVVLTKNESIHLQSLKSLPAIENTANSTQCIECGLCEPVCPSRHVTTTPRQRIALRREMARQPEGSRVLATLQRQYEYGCVETCAGDSMCARSCPLDINTGTLMRELRHLQHGDKTEAIALSIAKRWSAVEKFARAGLGATEIASKTIGLRVLSGLTSAARTAIAADLIPVLSRPMPRPAPNRLPATDSSRPAAVYFPACINRIFGRDPAQQTHPSLPEAVVSVSARAGKPLWIPPDVYGLCCAAPWRSRGYQRGHAYMAAAVSDAMWRWSDCGAKPIVVDAASCTLGLVEDVARHLDEDRKVRHEQIRFLDVVDWCQELLPRLHVSGRLDRVALHPTCSTTHLGLNGALQEIAEALADEVYVPPGTICCGMAGDRGLLYPEIVVSATREEKAGLDANPASRYISANRACEIGLRQATGKPYESFVFLLEELSRPAFLQEGTVLPRDHGSKIPR
jgi:D-lactate dehydrogenase